MGIYWVIYLVIVPVLHGKMMTHNLLFSELARRTSCSSPGGVPVSRFARFIVSRELIASLICPWCIGFLANVFPSHSANPAHWKPRSRADKRFVTIFLVYTQTT